MFVAVTVVAVDVTLTRAKTVQIMDDTKRRLDLLGSKGETYDAIIRRLLDSYVRGRLKIDWRRTKQARVH